MERSSLSSIPSKDMDKGFIFSFLRSFINKSHEVPKGQRYAQNNLLKSTTDAIRAIPVNI